MLKFRVGAWKYESENWRSILSRPPGKLVIFFSLRFFRRRSIRLRARVVHCVYPPPDGIQLISRRSCN